MENGNFVFKGWKCNGFPEKSGLGFWGVVFAVIVALLILSIF